ncbi:MAG TPA: hypothetical protein VGA53_03415 [Candidatus Paceibacterota bacterium]
MNFLQNKNLEYWKTSAILSAIPFMTFGYWLLVDVWHITGGGSNPLIGLYVMSVGAIPVSLYFLIRAFVQKEGAGAKFAFLLWAFTPFLLLAMVPFGL